MSDLLARLRTSTANTDPTQLELELDAADEIERLREQLASIVETCAKVAEGTAPIARGNFFEARRKQCVHIAAKIRSLSAEAGQ